MKLLFASTEWGRQSWGGTAESVLLWTRALDERGHEVWVERPNLPGGQLPSERMFISPAFQVAFARKLLPLARKADLVHAQDRRILVAGWLAARLAGKPCVLTLRDVGLNCPIVTCLLSHRSIPADCGQRKLWKTCSGEFEFLYGGSRTLRSKLALRYAWLTFERWIARRYDAVTFVSKGLMEVYEQAGFLPKNRAVTYSIASSATPLRQRPISAALFVGKPSYGKGFDLFAEATWRLPEKGLYLHIGPIPVGSYPSQIKCLGMRSPEDVATFMAGTLAVVIPPLQCDALPRVGLEALALGKPIVATRVGGLPEMVTHGLNGVLVDPGDARALANAIMEVLAASKENRIFMGKQSLELARMRFSPTACAEQLEHVYAEASSTGAHRLC